MRIDAHQHFWDITRLAYPWMPPGDSVLRRNYLPEDLAPVLEEHRFDGTVVVQANVVLEETWWLLDLAARHAFIRGVVGWVDLTDERVGETLDQCQRHPKFRGVRHIVHDEPDVRWLLREDVLRGLRELARRDIPYDLLLRPPHLPLIPELADRVPGLRMVIDHIAKPLIASHGWEPWARDMETVSKIPGMHCKLSGMITEADHQRWSADDLRPYVQHVLSLFGPGRLMFGSDWPVCRLAGSWKKVLAAFTQACGPLPNQEREKILGETAMKFYRLS
ncbi:MAG TPA: amidohydrolase family protein [Bryobacteraceae bacterium]|nr:amidohydrolase family protein [Bryobacteraceae bacterium]